MTGLAMLTEVCDPSTLKALRRAEKYYKDQNQEGTDQLSANRNCHHQRIALIYHTHLWTFLSYIDGWAKCSRFYCTNTINYHTHISFHGIVLKLPALLFSSSTHILKPATTTSLQNCSLNPLLPYIKSRLINTTCSIVAVHCETYRHDFKSQNCLLVYCVKNEPWPRSNL